MNIPRINKPMTEHNIITIFFIDRLCDRDADANDGSSGDDGFNDGVDDFFGEGADDGSCEDDGFNDGVDDFLVKVLMMVRVKMMDLMKATMMVWVKVLTMVRVKMMG